MTKFLFLLLLTAGLACRRETLTLSVFRELSSPVTADLSAVWFTDSLRGAAVGGAPWGGGVVLSTADGGESWQIDTLVRNKLECVTFSASGQGYACGMDGLALFRPPGGSHWQPFREDWCWTRACHFPDDRHGVFVCGEGYRGGRVRTAGPESFSQVQAVPQEFPNELHSVWMSDSLTVHAVGYGWLMRSTDAGASWQRQAVPGDFYRSVHFPTPNVGYACGYQGTLLKTTDAGRSWQTLREGGFSGRKHRAFRALWFVTAERGWLVGEGGLFWHTANGGADWQPVAGAPTDADFTDVFALADRGWAVATGGRIFCFTE